MLHATKGSRPTSCIRSLCLCFILLSAIIQTAAGAPQPGTSAQIEKSGEEHKQHPNGKGRDDKSLSGDGTSATAKITGPGITGIIKFEYVKDLGFMAVNVSISGLPAGLHPYHIHEHGVVGGDCASALEHFNPTNIPSTTHCDRIHPKKTCQMGDLSAKYGPLSEGKIKLAFYEPFLKFSPQKMSIIGKSVVIHSPDLKRIACGNIESASASTTK